MKNYIKYKLYNIFTGVFFYISALIFNIFVSGQFFFVQKFFGGNGTTDFHYFFNAIPLISAIIVPLLKLNENISSYDEIIPLCTAKKILAGWISLFVQFSVILLPQFLVPFCVNLFGNIEIGQVFSGFLMTFFYGAVSSALCVFFSQLCRAKAVSAIISIFALSVFNGISLFSVFAGNSVFFAEIIKMFSFYRHFDAAAKGIIDTRDLIYFSDVSALLVFLSVLVSEKNNGKIFSEKEKKRAFLVLLCSLFLLLDSSRFYARFDFTKGNKYSISKYSKKLTEEAAETVEISLFQSRSLLNYYPEAKNIREILKEYSEHKNISLKIYNTDKAENAKKIEQYGIFPRQIPVIGNNKTEYLNIYSAVILEYMDRTEAIPFILATNTLEYDIDTKLINLFSEKKRGVNIIAGNGMNLSADYGYVIPWLNSNGIEVNAVNLDENIKEQLEKNPVLAVFGSDKITEKQCEEIYSYIEKGNSVFFAVSPYNADIENSWYITKPENQNLIRMLDNLGFSFSENLMADISCARILMQSNQNEDGTPASSVYSQQINYPMWINIMPQKNAPQGITEYWPAELVQTEDTEPLLFTSPLSWTIEPDSLSKEKLFETNPFVIKEKKYDQEKSTRIAALSSKDRKLVLVPDQYFVNSLMLGYTGGETGDYRNLDFLVNQILKLNGEENLAEIHEHSTLLSNTGLFKTYSAELFLSAKNKTLCCMFIFVPAVIVLAGILFNLNRLKMLRKQDER